MNINNIAESLPIELRAHLYQKLESLKAYLAPGIEIDVQINPNAKEGFAIAYTIKGSGVELKTDAKGENAFSVTTEATNNLILQLEAAKERALDFIEKNSSRPLGVVLH